jgi:hypothetical protein
MSTRMKAVKKTDEWKILQKRSGRYAVQQANGDFVNGEDKLKILTAEGLAAKPPKKAASKAEAAPAAEAEPAEAEETEKPAE